MRSILRTCSYLDHEDRTLNRGVSFIFTVFHPYSVTLTTLEYPRAFSSFKAKVKRSKQRKRTPTCRIPALSPSHEDRTLP
jgi:hypothetical protein